MRINCHLLKQFIAARIEFQTLLDTDIEFKNFI